MARSPAIAIGISFRDRGANRARSQFHCAVGVSPADAWTLARVIADRMAALSDATLVEIELTWRYTIDDLAEPDASADLSRKILMLCLNEDDEINGMVIPAPADNWETSGSYAGIRLDLASAGAVGFVSMLESMDVRTNDNRAFGTILAAGGLAI